ncbi:transcriptional factor B3 [Trifolium medium]|uniref:Transcriptional factor B3 n=1 Tax=Trifolium medium TaxID=97028 RepID=A0A392MMA9_9FABA|nr:transcriptional factor B3 [Trifolium medium]
METNGMATPPIFMWQQTIKKYEGDGHGVIEFPDHVVEQCLLKEHKLITLIDEQNSKSYECEIETVNGGSNKKYVAKGWFKYLEEVGLNDGEKVLFNVDNPPKNMYVYRLDFIFN